MIWFTLLAVVAAFLCGFGSGVIYNDAALEVKRVTHKEEMDVIYEEVKRLRAQNAMLIGKE